ncbi:BZ3500_MvSof-1268-A1-R1_Chr11-3g03586 [Microbotryum saponariae]|uniref:BZ3500_MvSof-1268-A1-R1_Chr11-3g03586 protein n=1 Tax=Microbotryum saponariae TaxID=289078 RepID=A0A2X0KTK9_9BASI|nr:BZ3500_MvSof-1268-A1-R1_Chr11-3g03586 [Microbotryum saponariae]SDA03595.1 BZ3501_MvSof-1269-A2-R1_Chr11g03163 [Microbotryum saponariae]
MSTSLLVHNLHCPSCVSHVTTLLSSAPLLLDPGYITVSLLTRLVTYRPRSGTRQADVVNVLREGGFQVEPGPLNSTPTSTSAAPSSSPSSAASPGAVPDPTGADRIERRPEDAWYISRSKRRQREAQHQEEQRRREQVHRQSCRACRGELSPTPSKLGEGDIGKGKAKEECVVPFNSLANVVNSTFVVSGMTCASCVNGLQSALSQNPRIKSQQVTLLPNQAVVSHDPALSVDHVRGMIEDAGFDAELVESVNVADTRGKGVSEKSDQANSGWYESKFVIEGMTCASCVQSLNGLFEQPTPGLRSAQVTLLPALATVVHDPNVLPTDVLIEMIEDRGYGAELLSSVPVHGAKGAGADIQMRTVKLRVEGMFCRSVGSWLERPSECSDQNSWAIHSKCSMAINTYLDSLQTAGTIISFDPCSMASPALSLTYVPQPPHGFTLRTLRSSIESFGPFTLHPVHTSSVLTLLARQAQARESRLILLRLCITVLFAIPAFIIGIVFVSLLPSSKSLRRYFEEPLWGSASRAMVVLFILATPVQFGVGFFFYQRAWHSLRGVWRRGGWREKLLRWGSMDTLVALGTTGGYAASVAFLTIEVRTQPSETMGASMEMGYFDSSIFLMMFILLGRYLEGISRQRTGDAIDGLANMKASTGLLYSGSLASHAAHVDAIGDEDNKSTSEADLDAAAQGSSITHELEVDYFEIDDILLVPSGSSVPLDAVVLPNSSSSNFDESSLTGESLPILKQSGDAVFAGTTNLGPSAVLVRATSNAGSTMLDGIVQVVRDAMGKKATVEKLADLITGIFVPCIVAIAVVTFSIWVIRGYSGNLSKNWLDQAERSSGGWSLFAVQFAVAVLVVACPCGIGLAAPTAQMVGTGMAARLGIVPFGGGEAFQNATKIEAVCFDKTGTLTKGEFTVALHRFYAVKELECDRATSMRIVKLVEEASTHPISIGVREFCTKQLGISEEPTAPVSVALIHSEEIAGRGLKAMVNVCTSSLEVLIGNSTLLSEHGLDLDHDTIALSDGWANDGCSIVFVAVRTKQPTQTLPEGSFQLLAAFGVQDQPREEARLVISALEKKGIAVFLCSGDHERTVRAVARSVGIADGCVFAQVLPLEKAKVVERLQLGLARTRIEELKRARRSTGWRRLLSPSRRDTVGAKVAFVGDGINDVVALAQADVGISMGTGSSITLSSSEFCLLSSNLSALLTLFALSKATINKILTNFAWACLFNGCLVPIAAGAFYDLGRTRLPPVWASLAMALSSISVVVNSLLLRWTFRVPKEVRDMVRN